LDTEGHRDTKDTEEQPIQAGEGKTIRIGKIIVFRSFTIEKIK
jgi:hypothetical protein